MRKVSSEWLEPIRTKSPIPRAINSNRRRIYARKKTSLSPLSVCTRLSNASRSISINSLGSAARILARARRPESKFNSGKHPPSTNGKEFFSIVAHTQSLELALNDYKNPGRLRVKLDQDFA